MKHRLVAPQPTLPIACRYFRWKRRGKLGRTLALSVLLHLPLAGVLVAKEPEPWEHQPALRISFERFSVPESEATCTLHGQRPQATAEDPLVIGPGAWLDGPPRVVASKDWDLLPPPVVRDFTDDYPSHPHWVRPAPISRCCAGGRH